MSKNIILTTLISLLFLSILGLPFMVHNTPYGVNKTFASSNSSDVECSNLPDTSEMTVCGCMLMKGPKSTQADVSKPICQGIINTKFRMRIPMAALAQYRDLACDKTKSETIPHPITTPNDKDKSMTCDHVTITRPDPNGTYRVGDSIPYIADARWRSSSDTIVSVELRIDSDTFGSFDSAPYGEVWGPDRSDTFVLEATAMISNGDTMGSETVPVFVKPES